MANKTLPFTLEQLERIAQDHPTPFHIYDEKGIRENARRLRSAFAWNQGFKEYFAVKACPNPYLMKLLMHEDFGMDCSSLPELLLSERVGASGENIMFTSNDTPAEEYIAAKRLGAVINLDDISHIPFLESCAGLPEMICLRYNPGPIKGGNAIIGHPEQAKYGFTRDQLFEGYRHLKDKGIRRFGLHTMVASNELNPQYFIDTAEILFGLAAEIAQKVGINFEFINLGGGIGIPYRPEQEAVDLASVSDGVRRAYEERLQGKGHPGLKIYLECGRMVTGPYGYLVSRVRHIKKTYKNYAGLDSCMANLMRPALYGAYHHISVPAKEDQPCGTVYDVTGSLCENNDKFAIDRSLPELAPGDLVVIHDAGAHGHAMGFQYNGKLRSAELLLREDGSVVRIRRGETPEDYFATLDFGALAAFKV
ncbi:MAG: diaminopimelate decarboxylase [Kiritimatiellae bacterium]|nr:diaminopimelate decarboxylase [Kiritimatiellia bacterium]MDD4024323.1 diaminopimelate decarboxylase [Kiritimatiellia bacterium]MDD4622761.1 diaminopimelate decarboxylase [Kiritimatiellia bacterium]